MDHAQDVLAVVLDEVGPIALGFFGEFAVPAIALGEQIPQAFQDQSRLDLEEIFLVAVADRGLDQKVFQPRLARLDSRTAGLGVKLGPIVPEPLRGIGVEVVVLYPLRVLRTCSHQLVALEDAVAADEAVRRPRCSDDVGGEVSPRLELQLSGLRRLGEDRFVDIGRQTVGELDRRQRRLGVGGPFLDVEPDDRASVGAEGAALQGVSGHEAETVHGVSGNTFLSGIEQKGS